MVGPEGPGFEVGGGLKADLLDFSVRESFDVYILIAGQLSGFVVGRPRRLTVWCQKADYIERGRFVAWAGPRDMTGRYGYRRERPGIAWPQCSMQGCNSSVGRQAVAWCLGGRMRWRWAVDDGLMEPLLPCTGECGARYR